MGHQRRWLRCAVPLRLFAAGAEIVRFHIRNKPRSLPNADCESVSESSGMLESREVAIKFVILSSNTNAR